MRVCLIITHRSPPQTAGEPECTFSFTGLLVGGLRNNYSAKMIELITYCQKNKDFLPKPEEVARELLRLEKAAAEKKKKRKSKRKGSRGSGRGGCCSRKVRLRRSWWKCESSART